MPDDILDRIRKQNAQGQPSPTPVSEPAADPVLSRVRGVSQDSSLQQQPANPPGARGSRSNSTPNSPRQQRPSTQAPAPPSADPFNRPTLQTQLEKDLADPNAGKVSPRVAAAERERKRYESRSFLGQRGEDIANAVISGSEPLIRVANRALRAYGSPQGPDILPTLTPEARANLQQKTEAAQGIIPEVTRGLAGAAVQMPAIIAAGTTGGLPGIAAYTAAGEDYTDPIEAAKRIAINTAIPAGAGKIAGRLAAPLITSAATPATRQAVRIGTEALGGAAGNVAAAGAMGESDPEKLIAQGIIGGGIGGALGARGKTPPERFGPRDIPVRQQVANVQNETLPYPQMNRMNRAPIARPQTEITRAEPLENVARDLRAKASTPAEQAYIQDVIAGREAPPAPEPRPSVGPLGRPNIPANQTPIASPEVSPRPLPRGSGLGAPNTSPDVAPAPPLRPQDVGFQQTETRFGVSRLPQGMTGDVTALPDTAPRPQPRGTGLGAPNIPAMAGEIATPPPPRRPPVRSSGLGGANIPSGMVLPEPPRRRPTPKITEAPAVIDRTPPSALPEPTGPLMDEPPTPRVRREPIIEERSRPPVDTETPVAPLAPSRRQPIVKASIEAPQPVMGKYSQDPVVKREIERMEKMGPDELETYISRLNESLREIGQKGAERRVAILTAAKELRGNFTRQAQLPKSRPDEPLIDKTRLNKGDMQAMADMSPEERQTYMAAEEGRQVIQAAKGRQKREAKLAANQAARRVEPQPVPQMGQETVTPSAEPQLKQTPENFNSETENKAGFNKELYATHKDFGDVTLSENQERVPKGKVRVVDADGKEHIIQKTNNNQSAIRAKKESSQTQGEPAIQQGMEKRPTSVENRVIQAARQVSGGETATRIRLKDIRAKLTDLPRNQVDAALNKLQNEGDLVLMENNDPQDITPEDTAAALVHGAAEKSLVYMKRFAERPETPQSPATPDTFTTNKRVQYQITDDGGRFKVGRKGPRDKEFRDLATVSSKDAATRYVEDYVTAEKQTLKKEAAPPTETLPVKPNVEEAAPQSTVADAVRTLKPQGGPASIAAEEWSSARGPAKGAGLTLDEIKPRLEVEFTANGKTVKGLVLNKTMNGMVKIADSDARIVEMRPEDLRLRGATERAAPAVPNDAPRKTRADVEATPEFQRFFKGSKVVDKEGKPQVVYHGTSADFPAFSKGRAASDAMLGKGFYFTDAPNMASSYGMKVGGRQNVMPVYLNIKNPADHATVERFGEQLDREGVDIRHSTTLTKRLQRAGYDGVYVTTPEGNIWVAFEPGQIKSAIGNKGTFNPKRADIRAQREGADFHGLHPHEVKSLRQVAENIQTRSSKSDARSNVLYTNAHANYFINKAAKELGITDALSLGANVRPRAANKLAAVLHIYADEAASHNATGAAENLRKLATSVEQAVSQGKPLNLVNAARGRTFGEIRKTVYHELTHDAEKQYKTSQGWFDAQPEAAKLAAELNARNYEPSEYVGESVAYISSGDHEAFGLTDKEAARFLGSYFDNLEFRRSGSTASFNPLAAKPGIIRETVRGAQQRYGTTYELGRGAGSEPLSAIAAGRRGKEPGGVETGVQEARRQGIGTLAPQKADISAAKEAPRPNVGRVNLAALQKATAARGERAGQTAAPAPRQGKAPATAREYFDNVIARDLAPPKERGMNQGLIREAHEVLKQTAIKADKKKISDAQAEAIIRATDDLMTAARSGDQKAIQKARSDLRKAQIGREYQTGVLGKTGALGKEVLTTAKEIGQTSRSAVFGADLSYPLRQAWPLVAGAQNIPRAIKTGKNVMFQALKSAEGGKRVQETIRNHEAFDRAENAGLELTGFSEGEEVYRGIEHLEKIPVLGKIYERTQAGNEAFLDWTRLETFNREMKKLDAQNLPENQRIRAERAIAEAINTLTGRTDLGSGKFKAAMDALQGTVFTAPRLNVSRLQLMNPVKYAQLAKESPQAAKLMAVQTGSAAATVVALGALGTLAGVGTFVTDREDADFGKFRMGQTAHDLSGGLLPQIKLALDVMDYAGAEGKNLKQGTIRSREDVESARKEMLNRAGSYIRTRETPVTGLAHDTVIKGKDFEGNPMTVRDLATTRGAGKALYRAFGPAFAADVYQGFSQGLGAGLQTLPTFLGSGVSVITPEMEKRRAEGKETATIQRNTRKLLDPALDAMEQSEQFKALNEEQKKLVIGSLKQRTTRELGMEEPRPEMLEPERVIESVLSNQERNTEKRAERRRRMLMAR